MLPLAMHVFGYRENSKVAYYNIWDRLAALDGDEEDFIHFGRVLIRDT